MYDDTGPITTTTNKLPSIFFVPSNCKTRDLRDVTQNLFTENLVHDHRLLNTIGTGLHLGLEHGICVIDSIRGGRELLYVLNTISDYTTPAINGLKQLVATGLRTINENIYNQLLDTYHNQPQGVKFLIDVGTDAGATSAFFKGVSGIFSASKLKLGNYEGIGEAAFKITNNEGTYLKSSGAYKFEISELLIGEDVWLRGPVDRGVIIEEVIGRNLHQNFPVIDRYSIGGIVTSIKSLDLNAKTYQNSSKLYSKIRNYVDEVFEFKGGRCGLDVVLPDSITERHLELAIPSLRNVNQVEVLKKAIDYSTEKSVILKIIEVKK